MSKIEQERRDCEKKLTCFQLCMDGSLASRNNKSLVSSRIKALESELDRKFVKFNDVVAENNCLRQEVDHLRLERASFDRIYSKMEREFKTKVQSISVLQNSISELEGERTALKSHLHGLKSTADAKQKIFEEKSAKIQMELELNKSEE